MPAFGRTRCTVGLCSALVAASVLVACGSSGKKAPATGGAGGESQGGAGGKGGGAGGKGGGAGQGGAGGQLAGGGGGGAPAAAGASGTAGQGGAAGAAGSAASIGGAAGQGSGGTGGGAAGGSAGGGGAGGLASGGVAGGGAGAGGSACLAPEGETALVPSAAGVPATGLVLWLRADRGVSKTAGQAVCAWADQSGHGVVFSAGQARPTWTATGLGNAPAIHFTGTGQSLATSSLLGLAPTGARTIIAVSQLVATSQRSQPFYQGQSGTPGTYLGLDANTFNTAGKREGVYVMNNAYDASYATATEPRVHVLLLDTMTPGMPILPAINYYINGGKQTLTRTAGGLGNGNFESFEAANYTSVGGDADIFLGEVLVYDRVLTSTERIAAEVALEDRYAVP